jgi:hypothetical protein
VTVTATPNVSVTSDSIEQPESTSFNVGFSHELRPNLALHLDGVYTKGRNGNHIANVNTPDPVTGVRPRPTWGNINEYRAGGESHYKAMYVRLDKRYSDQYQYLVSYTLSKEDDWGSGGTTITDFYHPEWDEGPGSQDRRHTVVASGAVQLPWEVTLGAVWNYRSSRPFGARAGIDLNRDGHAVNTAGDWVPGTTRNVFNRGDDAKYLALVNAWRAQNGRSAIQESQLMTDEFQRFDVRVTKQVSLGGALRAELIAQVLNLFGTDSFGPGATPWQMNALSNAFGTIGTVHPRQQGELAIKVVW